MRTAAGVVRAGIYPNLVAIGLVTLAARFLVPLLLK